jgi:hypothetical protein
VPRPNHGYTEVFYAYVKPENKHHVEHGVKKYDFTKSDFANAAIELDRKTGIITKLLAKEAKEVKKADQPKKSK